MASENTFEPMLVLDKDMRSFAMSPTSSLTWFRRTFKPMGQGSVRGSVFTLASTAMGAGYLATPNILLNAGVILGLGIIIFCGMLIYLSLMTVARCAEKHKIYHYPSVARKILGNKWAVLLEIAIIMNGYGIILALNIIVGSLIPIIISSFGVEGHGSLERALAMIALNVCVVTPLGIMRNLGALRFKALFNVTCISFVMLVLIIEFPFFVEENNFDTVKYAGVDITIFSAFSVSLFAYLCHQNITRIQSELENPSILRMKKVTGRSVGIMCTLFCLISLFGYLSCLHNTPHLIILRKAPSNISNDAAMVICRIMITFTMSIAIPINLNPCRVSIQKLFFKVEGKASNLMHYGITFFIIGSTLIIAIFYPNVEIVFHFLGGFCGGIMALIIPGLMYVKSSEKPLTHWNNIAVLALSWILALVGFTSLAIDVYSEVK
ncbi:hypothetical protein SteCoe_27436 [Stentor coeruleus]|uniref:Amino acid transporter transmembrane domain-containing protein n=1 Tax=Stentor coeruleus TaxID=5963 RepID=A0A1R2BAL0_9CILI|nr:hypothetical protein SteCoe_27436 [Stentor coeruleus]